MINQGEVEPNKIGKTVLVIDEAQDMGVAEYTLVKALMASNEEMRVIAVGDDDQNIYEFRGSDSGYMYRLVQEPGMAIGSYTRTFAPARVSKPIITKAVASRISSVSGLKARPQIAIVFPDRSG